MQFGADCVNYMDVLVIAKVIDGVLDFPYPVYWFNAAHNNINYSSLTDCPQGVDLLCNVHVKIEDYAEAIKLPNVVMDFQNDERVKAFWSKTEGDEIIAQSLAIELKEGDEPKEIIDPKTMTKLAPFCISGKMYKEDIQPVSLDVKEEVILTEVKLQDK